MVLATLEIVKQWDLKISDSGAVAPRVVQKRYCIHTTNLISRGQTRVTRQIQPEVIKMLSYSSWQHRITVQRRRKNRVVIEWNVKSIRWNSIDFLIIVSMSSLDERPCNGRIFCWSNEGRELKRWFMTGGCLHEYQWLAQKIDSWYVQDPIQQTTFNFSQIHL